ncbi:MAG: DNA topoisomerase I [uncultured Quadrisphaera sp.]|uniref:DNA topoisomerase 1 n=1 Tax=uncultured Quadrisphaera sp. TaxID=904978 RepID=A0A6J4Q1F9_9ACTN|nr:MAG: DNA topoisomerase I [uncultured Quadrisphaera sp.]
MARSAARAQETTRRLVIVESPAKARTIAGYLGAGYEVEASVGHIRDLPQPSELPAEMKKGPFGKFAVDVDHGFEPYYVVDADKKKKVAELKRALKDADELYLATDEDREGEAIAWHLLQTLQPKVPVRRMVFHEITPEAIRRALDDTRDIDAHLVDAQETRRILDRLYGYEVSPVLWRKVRAGLSAGRVQSVATRMVVERERERMAFRSASYWDVTALLDPLDAPAGQQERFSTRLVAVDGARVATGRDFDDRGRLQARSGTAPVLLDEPAATAIATGLGAAAPGALTVRSVETKPYTRRPAAPFTTSTLQQEASRKLRSSAKATMRTAQTLYENGYITYMRTDSVALSDQAVRAARSQATELYGPEFVPDRPRVYASKSKNAQEAHEAVRPAGDVFRTPAQVAGALRGEEYRLYELIWQRTVASQMADARGSTASVRIGGAVEATTADGAPGRRDVELAASGTVITFRGFMAAYEEGRDEEQHAAEGADGGGERRLPELTRGQGIDVASAAADGHQTSPPPRYTEASLVKALEERGIGRPSTYASTIATITDRGYVWRRGTALVPTWIAFAVTRLLEEHFGSLVDYDFTASMEDDLDRIAGGTEQRADWLSRFYFGGGAGVGGDGPGAGTGPAGAGGPGSGPGGLKPLVDDLGDIDARDINSIDIGEGITLRVGRYGPYLEVAGGADGVQRASVPDDVAPDELTVEKARELFAASGDGERELGTDPATGRAVVARSGRYGPYVTEVLEEGAPKSAKPRTGSLFSTMQPATVTLDDALRLLSLPRTVGVDPATGEEITAQNGRYGPYLKRGTDSRSLEGEEQIFDVTLEQALALYAQPKRGRGASGASAAPLRELGTDPASGAPVVVKEGRFGAYVTDGAVNATLRKDDAVESITIERAAELLADKRARDAAGGGKRPARKPAKAPAKTSAKAKSPAKGAAKSAATTPRRTPATS